MLLSESGRHSERKDYPICDKDYEIATELHISEPRVYQLIARPKAIGREYRQKNG